jgi:hypothetical protein
MFGKNSYDPTAVQKGFTGICYESGFVESGDYPVEYPTNLIAFFVQGHPDFSKIRRCFIPYPIFFNYFIMNSTIVFHNRHSQSQKRVQKRQSPLAVEPVKYLT